MKGLIATIVLAGLFVSAGLGEPLLVGTWNVQNYLLQNRYLNGKYRFDYPKPEIEKEGLRQLLLEARPGILFLQEIGSRAFLHELQRDLAARGLEYPYKYFSRLDGNRSGLAVLSLVPIQKALFHDQVPVDLPGDPAIIRRGLQEVHVTIDGTGFVFFHIHLKSRHSTDPDDPSAARIRTAEIKALASFLDAYRPQLTKVSPFLVGDFNTPFSSPLLDPLKESWIPVTAPNPDGSNATYTYWRTQSSERLDGFWIPRAARIPLRGMARTCPPPSPPPSDHRLVLLSLQPLPRAS